MKLHVLGSSAASPSAGDACSGYLVSHADTHVVLDCGSGVMSRLQSLIRLDHLSAVYITHFHPDHYLDVVTLRYALRYRVESTMRPRLLVPPGGTAFLAQLGMALRRNSEMFSGCFDIEEYASGHTMHVGAFELQVQRTTHDEPNWAVAVSGPARLVYTGDTQASTDLERFAREADLLVCEATYPTHDGHILAENHLTGRQAGELAQRARARRLLLTHFWPEFSRAEIVQEAAQAFGGEVLCARPGLEIAVEPARIEAARA